ncbi:MAG TPA: hypothetical protein PL070_20415, partial [Flavobacteriales bacterium]|nr:hypothetical protein [Flavobacteriales bacterium]
MKYDWLVDRNADPSLIRMRFEGADGLILEDGTLRVKTSAGDVIEQRPVAWQVVHGSKVDVPVEYRIKERVLSYVLPSGHDPKHPLVIDPVVVFCSF